MKYCCRDGKQEQEYFEDFSNVAEGIWIESGVMQRAESEFCEGFKDFFSDI